MMTRPSRSLRTLTGLLLLLGGGSLSAACGGDPVGGRPDTAVLADTAPAEEEDVLVAPDTAPPVEDVLTDADTGSAPDADGALADGDDGDIADSDDRDIADATDADLADSTDGDTADLADGADSDGDTADGDTPDVVAPACPGGHGGVIGPDGGAAVHGAATLTVPPGALTDPTLICIHDAAAPAPVGYTAYSPRYTFSPSGLTFASPAQLAIALDATPPRPVAGFLSRAAGPAFDWLGATTDGLVVTTLLPHFSDVFVGDGETFSDPPDSGCAATRLLEGRVVPPSGVALFVTADDCHGTPLTALAPEAFVLREDGETLTSESARVARAHDGVAAFVTLVFDMSGSTAAVLPDLVAAARAFVTQLATAGGAVHVAVTLFSGPQHSELWQEFTLDAAAVHARLDALASYVSPDPASTNLRGAVVGALAHSAAAQAAYRARQHGGAFTLGHVLVFTDGRDTAGWLPEATAVAAVAGSTDEVVGVGLRRDDYDEAALARLARGGVYSALDGPGLATAFVARAHRVARQVARSYALFYCSPKKIGFHVARVGLAGAVMAAEASFTFAADGFAPGCGVEAFTAACDGRTCGGLGCGGCDERRDVCVAEAGACVDACTAACVAPGAAGGPIAMVHPAGHALSCDVECDADAVALPVDNCPWVDNAAQADADGDGAGDACDGDRDGDGVDDASDACLGGAVGWGSEAASDHDGDGCRDADEDADDDADGVADAADGCPKGELGWTSVVANDRDRDGCRDASEDTDDDADGVADAVDGCPVGPLGWTSEAASDHDGDGCRDSDADSDDDGDGLADVVDQCPVGEIGWPSGVVSDHDGDGCRDDGEDADDDGDGVPDASDACPRGETGWEASQATDRDGDGCRDATEDLDDDGDGVNDAEDACPNQVTSSLDTDGDGCSDDSHFVDSDADGVFDADDLCAGDGPCLCAPPLGWCLVEEAPLAGVDPPGDEGTASFGAGGAVCIVRWDDVEARVALRTVDGVEAWEVPVFSTADWPPADAFSGVTRWIRRAQIEPRHLPGVACALVLQAGRSGRRTATGTWEIFDREDVLIEVGFDGVVVRTLPLRSYVGWIDLRVDSVTYGYSDGIAVQAVASLDPVSGAELWHSPIPELAGYFVGQFAGVTLNTGETWVGGGAFPTGGGGSFVRPGVVWSFTPTGEPNGVLMVEGPCPCGQCNVEVRELHATSDGTIRLSGWGLHRATLDPTTATISDFVSNCYAGACGWGSSGWADADCRLDLAQVIAAPGIKAVTVVFCDVAGPLSTATYGHGYSYPEPRQVRARAGAVDILASVGDDQIRLATLAPCEAAPDPCDDHDLCTVDAATPTGCSHEVLPIEHCDPYGVGAP